MRFLLAAASLFIVAVLVSGCCCPCPSDLSSAGALAVAHARGDVPPVMPATTITVAQRL